MRRSKRIELLEKVAKLVGNPVLYSKKGNPYVVIESDVYEREVRFNYYNATKNQLHKIGSSHRWDTNRESILILRKLPTYKDISGQTSTTYKALSVIEKQFAVGKINYPLFMAIANFLVRDYKGEWLKNHREYIKYFNFFKSFSSPREAKNYLGFRNLPLKDFLLIQPAKAILLGCLTDETNKVKAARENNLYFIEDTINMVNKLGIIDIPCPRDFKRFHDELAMIISAQKYSGKIFETEDVLEQYLIDNNLQYEKINSVLRLAKEGIAMKHCVVSREEYLTSGDRTYYHIVFKGIPYTLEFSVRNRKILECKGKSNISGSPLSNFLNKKFTHVKKNTYETAYPRPYWRDVNGYYENEVEEVPMPF